MKHRARLTRDARGRFLRGTRHKTRINASPESMAEARAEYRRAHWGDGGDTDKPIVLPMADPSLEVFVILGELVSVTYRTTKGGEDADWEHPFDDPPLLVYGLESKRLGVAGGSYTVTRAGIKG